MEPVGKWQTGPVRPVEIRVQPVKFRQKPVKNRRKNGEVFEKQLLEKMALDM